MPVLHLPPHPPTDPRTKLGPLLGKVRADYRRAAAMAVLALASAVTGHVVSGAHIGDHARTWAGYGCALGFVLFGVAAVRMVANEASRVTTLRAGTAAGGPVRVLALLGGYGVVGLVTLDLVHLPLGHLLVGGAITGIVLGIAAQQSLGNLFAGLVLLFTRPYVPGQRVVIRSGSINGPLTGTITGIGLLYTTLLMAEGPTNIPNSILLASAVGPAPAEESAPSGLPSQRRG